MWCWPFQKSRKKRLFVDLLNIQWGKLLNNCFWSVFSVSYFFYKSDGQICVALIFSLFNKENYSIIVYQIIPQICSVFLCFLCGFSLFFFSPWESIVRIMKLQITKRLIWSIGHPKTKKEHCGLVIPVSPVIPVFFCVRWVNSYPCWSSQKVNLTMYWYDSRASYRWRGQKLVVSYENLYKRWMFDFPDVSWSVTSICPIGSIF